MAPDENIKFRIGSVEFLNAMPLTRGLENEIIFDTPAQLAQMLRRDELDAALVSITEVLLNDRYDILDGIAIASLGEVYSVFLAHRVPLEQITEVFCDTASLTSVNLLKVLLAERGLVPAFKPLPDYASALQHDAVLLIGDAAIDFRRANPAAPGSGPTASHEIFDLGAAWFEMTNLPFVYAVWALRRGIPNQDLRRELRLARHTGMTGIEELIKNVEDYDEDFRRDYFEWHIHYHLAEEEKRGIAKFCELLTKHALGPVFAPKFVP